MLVLTRKIGESILIGDNIELSILEVNGEVVKLGITAPKEIGILRKELYSSVEEMNKTAEQSHMDADTLKNQINIMKK
ncbi:carbon storage regulator CsrA [Paenibacillus sp. L3-i20]|uniref:carbon storage regulator CsrA n=1 Tax=Paenibacillus sp. L3-i20 TaxID=2905833 RepID=UPI001EDF1595|nr:carbon storage regulator CsrA [Paenibacillus sp. L3-i20]GKU76821.1 carbon storage regulator [Paenibacillus sp. L3-i20]